MPFFFCFEIKDNEAETHFANATIKLSENSGLSPKVIVLLSGLCRMMFLLDSDVFFVVKKRWKRDFCLMAFAKMSTFVRFLVNQFPHQLSGCFSSRTVSLENPYYI
jgi:hypothetical protein